MDSDEGGRHLEPAREPLNLTYGHFGTATYDHHASRAWAFTRQDGWSPVTTVFENGNPKPIDTPQLALLLQEEVRSPGNSPTGRPLQTLASKNSSSRHLRLYPDLVFASKLLTDHQVSETAPRNHAYVLTSQLLTHAYAVRLSLQEEVGHSIPYPLVVLGSGAAGDVLEIANLQLRTATVHEATTWEHSIQYLSMGGPSHQHSLSSSQPILQVSASFSHGQDKTAFIAVRTASLITILRPVHLRSVGNPAGNAESEFPAIQLQHVTAIPTSRTGGQPHAHLAFNPRNEHQLAVVDVRGNWSIWHIDGKAPRSARVRFKSYLQSSGRLLPHHEKNSRSSTFDDGWHQICWLSDTRNPTDTILVCCRQTAQLFDVHGSALQEVDMRLGPRSKKQALLDVHQFPTHPHICAILTSTSIMVMRLNIKSETSDPGSGGLELLCSWSHFRASDDLSTQLRVLDLSNTEGMMETSQRSGSASLIHIALFSQRNKEINVFPVKLSSEGVSTTAEAGDMFSFPVPKLMKEHDAQFRDIEFNVMRLKKPSPEVEYEIDGILFSFIAQMADGAVIEAWFRYIDNAEFQILENSSSAVPIFPKAFVHRMKSSRYVADIDDDGVDAELADFVVDEDPVGLAAAIHPSWRATRSRRQPRAVTNSFASWSDVLAQGVVQDPTRNLYEKLGEFCAKLLRNSPDVSPGSTITQAIGDGRVEDIEELPDAITNLIGGQELGDILLALIREDNLEPPLTIYNGLFDHYISRLRDEVPDRIRMNTERLARNVAAEIYLSTFTLRSPGLPPTGNHKQNESHSQPSASGESSTFRETPVSGPLDRLSKYTSVDQAKAVQTNPNAESEILSHLPTDISFSPADYSYQDAELSLTMARDQLALDNDPRARRQTERVAARQKRRLDEAERRRKDVLSRDSMDVTEPGVGLTVQSQIIPQRQNEPGSSSQISQGQPVNMTQPERGIHGARQQTQKIGAKKRLKGF